MMFRKLNSAAGMAAVLAALVTPGNSAGQSTYRYPYNYGFNLGQYPYYYSNLYPLAETSVHYQPMYHAVYYPGLGYSLRYEATGTSSPLWNSYQSFTPTSSSAAGSTSGTPATLDVRVPNPNAEVWIDGHQTTQKGTTRRYESPPLTPGRNYQYEVRVQWNTIGGKVEQTQTVTLQAGHRIAIDFLATTPSR